MNPGSPEAVDAGCECPVMDNRHGRGVPFPSGPVFWMNQLCPLHGHGLTKPTPPSANDHSTPMKGTVK